MRCIYLKVHLLSGYLDIYVPHELLMSYHLLRKCLDIVGKIAYYHRRLYRLAERERDMTVQGKAKNPDPGFGESWFFGGQHRTAARSRGPMRHTNGDLR